MLTSHPDEERPLRSDPSRYHGQSHFLLITTHPRSPKESAVSFTSRHRADSQIAHRSRRVVVALACAGVAAMLIVVSWSVVGLPGSTAARPCPLGGDALQIVAAPEIAPAISAVVGAADGGLLTDPSARGASEASGACPAPVVRAARPVEMARTLATDAEDRPDVWIPDSSYWTRPRGLGG